MQCKDVPTIPILIFLHDITYNLGANSFDKDLGGDNINSIRHAMPDNTPSKVVYAKMRKLISRGLISGCGCYGCRGDFEITKKGIDYLLEAMKELCLSRMSDLKPTKIIIISTPK